MLKQKSSYHPDLTDERDFPRTIRDMCVYCQCEILPGDVMYVLVEDIRITFDKLECFNLHYSDKRPTIEQRILDD